MKKQRKPCKLKKRNNRGGQYAIVEKAADKCKFTGTTDKDESEELAQIKYGLTNHLNAAHHKMAAEAHWMF